MRVVSEITNKEITNYKQRVSLQVKHWADGISYHNDIDDECCPDFSCCKPEFLADKTIRETFKNANDEQRESLLFSFLGSALSNYFPEKDIFIANGKDEITSELN